MTPQENAALLMQHAHQRIASMKSTKKHRLKKWFTHKTSQGVRSLDKRDGVKLAITATAITGSIIVSGVLTGGLSVGVIAAIGGTSYALKKLVKTYGHKRLNRNWLKNYGKAYNSQSKNYSNALSVTSKDAIRRAVDHYNKTREILKEEVAKQRDANSHGFTSCEDAINWAKSVARFIHHSDKTRNYLLPCIDMSVFFVMQYKVMLMNWERHWGSLEGSLIQWFAYHNTAIIGHCNRNPNEICYGTAYGEPVRPSIRGSKIPKAPNNQPDENDVDIYELAQELAEKSVKSIETAMRRGENMPELVHNNYSSVNPQSNLSQMERLQAGQGDVKRFNRLIDDVFDKIDRPGYFTRSGHSIKHTFTRRTTTEKIGFLFGEALMLASLSTPFLPTKELGSAFGGMLKFAPQTITKASLTSTSILNSVISDYIAGSKGEKTAIASGLINRKVLDEVAKGEIRGAGVKVQELITKTGTHFRNSIRACEEIEGITGCEIRNCRQAWELAKTMAIAMHELNKMEKYLMATISVVNFLADETIKWTECEPELWREMEEHVAAWVFNNENHHACRERNKHCYGPKLVSKVRGGTFTNRLHRRKDYSFQYDVPQKPL